MSTALLSMCNGYALLSEMRTQSSEPILKSLPKDKREVMAKPVAPLNSDVVTGYGASIHLSQVESCVVRTKAPGQVL